MEPRRVIKLEVRNGRRLARGRAGGSHLAASDGPEIGSASDGEVVAIDHREIDALLLQEARRASDELLKASAALHAASSVVLEALETLRDERDNR